MKDPTLERFYRVWNNNTGESWTIGPDGDGLDMIEIAYKDETGKKGPYLLFTKAQAYLISVAIRGLTEKPETEA